MNLGGDSDDSELEVMRGVVIAMGWDGGRGCDGSELGVLVVVAMGCGGEVLTWRC
jgi:hypothetical protein